MAYSANYLVPLAGQGRRENGPTYYTYWTLDTHATVDESGYFNDASLRLRNGDIILVTVWSTAIGDGGTISTYGTHIVNSNSSGVVDVSNVTVGTVTDSD